MKDDSRKRNNRLNKKQSHDRNKGKTDRKGMMADEKESDLKGGGAEGKRKALKAELREVYLKLLLKTAAAAAVIFILLFAVFGITVVEGDSMSPAMKDGDVAFFYRLDNRYSIGDVVVYKVNDIRYIGRIIAQEGDSVDFTGEGWVTINGNVQQDELHPCDRNAIKVYLPCVVPKNSYFILCDERLSGEDSRVLGTVDEDSISGTVFTLLRRRGI